MHTNETEPGGMHGNALRKGAALTSISHKYGVTQLGLLRLVTAEARRGNEPEGRLGRL